MRKKIILLIAVIVVLGGILGLRDIRKNKNTITVKTAAVTKGKIESYLSTTGIINSQYSKDYYASQSKIKSVNVKTGDIVKKGQLLIIFDIPDMSTSIKQAEIQYENAVLQRNDTVNMKKDIDEKIFQIDSKIVAIEKSNDPQDKVQLDVLKQQKASIQTISDEKIQMLQNQVDIAKLNLDSINRKYKETQANITAQNDGKVIALNAEAGALYSAMQPIITIADTNNLKVIVSLGKYDADKVKVGQNVRIRNENKIYKGKVNFIEPAAQKIISPTGSETTLNAEININEKSPDLKINFDADVDILLGEADNILKVPAESIKTDKYGNAFLYLLDGNRAKEVKVKTGFESDLEVQIIDGVSEGEKVILNPGASIINDSIVREDTNEASK